MRSTPRFVFASLAAAASIVSACTSDDTVAPFPHGDGGADATVDGSGGTEGGGGPAPDSLCAKYGGTAQVEKMVQAVVAAVSADCKIDAYFTGLAETDKVHFQDCLGRQVEEMMGCGVTYAGSNDTLGQPCRSMAEAHQNLDNAITSDDFDAFIIDVTQTLKAQGVSTDDVSKIAPSFLSTKQDVVQSGDQGLSNSVCSGPPVDGGKDAAGQDAGTDAGSDAGGADASSDADDSG